MMLHSHTAMRRLLNGLTADGYEITRYGWEARIREGPEFRVTDDGRNPR